MKVALVTEYLTEIGGAEHDLANLAEIFPDAPIYTIIYQEHKYSKINPSRIIESYFGKRLPKFLKKRRRWLLPFLPRAAERIKIPSDIDVVISVSHSFAKGIKVPKGAKHICYCLSPTRYLWDWTHKYVQEQKKGVVLSFIARWMLHWLRSWDFNAAQRVDEFIANSKTVQKRILKFYRRKADVVYPGVDLERFKRQDLIDIKNLDSRGWELGKEKYWLIVSQLSKFKNVELVIKGFNKLGLPLCIVGSGDQEKYLRSISKSNINFLGRVSDEELVSLYHNCYAVIVPCEEDFGLVVVEAIACGKPVLALKAGGSLETIKEGVTGAFFEGFSNLESFIDGVERIRNGYKKGCKILDDEYHPRSSKEMFSRNIRRQLDQESLSR